MALIQKPSSESFPSNPEISHMKLFGRKFLDGSKTCARTIRNLAAAAGMSTALRIATYAGGTAVLGVVACTVSVDTDLCGKEANKNKMICADTDTLLTLAKSFQGNSTTPTEETKDPNKSGCQPVAGASPLEASTTGIYRSLNYYYSGGTDVSQTTVNSTLVNIDAICDPDGRVVAMPIVQILDYGATPLVRKMQATQLFGMEGFYVSQLIQVDGYTGVIFTKGLESSLYLPESVTTDKVVTTSNLGVLSDAHMELRLTSIDTSKMQLTYAYSFDNKHADPVTIDLVANRGVFSTLPSTVGGPRLVAWFTWNPETRYLKTFIHNEAAAIMLQDGAVINPGDFGLHAIGVKDKGVVDVYSLGLFDRSYEVKLLGAEGGGIARIIMSSLALSQ